MWSILLCIVLTLLLIVKNLKRFYEYYVECKFKKKQDLYNDCPIGISVEEKIDELIIDKDRSWERGTKRVGREKLDDEILNIILHSTGVLLRIADNDPELNGDVKTTIEKIRKVKDKRSEFIRNELIE